MTPAEKAKELYIKYKDALNIRNDMRPGANPFAKQCALIAVEEIIDETKKQAVDHKDDFRLLYWQQVKTEIENIT